MTAVVEVDCVVKRVTERALLINFGAPEEAWVPLSMVSDFCGDGDTPDYSTTSIFIPEWLAVEKGIL